MSITSFKTYRDVIQKKLQENTSVRGYKSRVCQALKIQNSYFSHVLNGASELTLDQASALCDFWHLDDTDSEYFITLVLLDRASSESLKKRLKKRLHDIEKTHHVLPMAEIQSFDMSLEHSLEYFSRWYVPAIHAALDIPVLRTVSALSRRLGLSEDLIARTLEKLAAMKIAHKSDKEWHLLQEGLSTRSQQMMSLYHAEIRRKANDVLVGGDSDGIHFSMVCTLSKDDFLSIKQQIRNLISSLIEQTTTSKKEEIATLTIDCFRLGRS